MSAIVLALGAALGWGFSDFLGGLKSRSVPLVSVLLVSQASALALLAAFTVLRGEGPPGADSLGFAALAGVAEVVGIAALYRGLAVGTMTIVAPVAATAPIVPLLAGMIGGEVPSAVQFLGIALALLGLVVMSYRSSGHAASVPGLSASVVYGLLAAVGFGTFFIAMDTASEGDVGWALVTARTAAVAIIATSVAFRRRPLALPRTDLPVIAVIGVLIVTADAFYATATTVGLVSIAAILGSLHTVVTMALARIVLSERLQRPQHIGVGATLVGVLAISAG